jgi:GntR family transcriptional regulator
MHRARRASGLSIVATVTSRSASSTTPAAIVADLARRIDAGEFAPGARLPSEQALADEYGTTRSRVRTVLAGLARQGRLASRAKSGWHVVSPHQTQPLAEMRSFAQWADQHDRRAGGRVFYRARQPVDATYARILGLRLDEPVLCTARVRTLDGRKVMVERSTWAPWVTPVVEDIPDDLVSTTAVLAEHGIDVLVGEHRIEAVGASSEDAKLLDVRRSSPMLQIARTTFTPDGRIVEVGVDHYLAGVIAFVVGSGAVIPSP